MLRTQLWTTLMEYQFFFLTQAGKPSVSLVCGIALRMPLLLVHALALLVLAFPQYASPGFG
jgi:hypothetical protein